MDHGGGYVESLVDQRVLMIFILGRIRLNIHKKVLNVVESMLNIKVHVLELLTLLLRSLTRFD